MNRLLLLAVLVGLTGCAEFGYAQDAYRNRFPDRGGRYDDYSRTPEYRRITSDAAQYASRVDRALRIGSGQERRIRDLLVDRTARLLQQTRPRDHRAVYPFPRNTSTRASRDFWDRADRDIERILGRRDADAYRRFVRYGDRYDDRDGRYRDDDRYRNDGRYDGRYDDRSRDDGERGRVRGTWGN